MSLHQLANQLAARGRNGDSTLVHMTKGEVAGLQALAKRNGTSLTRNPETGLPEAFSLRSLLPMIAGAALAATGIGAPMAAAMIGGGTALAKGDLKAGLMAGIGAYGGAGLAGGAASLGGQAAGEAAGAEALGTTPGAMATETGSQAALSSTTPPPAGYEMMDPGVTAVDPARAQLYSAEYAKAAQPSFSNMGSGAQQAVSSPEGFGKYVDATGGGVQTAKYGAATLAPMVSTNRQPLPEEDPYDGPLSKYRFDPDKYQSADRSQPNPYYQARMYNYAGGGAVEQMSNANAIGANTGYPMADINKAVYSTPYQTPISQNMVTGTADTGVNPMTGEMSFAGGGGISSLGSYSDGGQLLRGPGDGTSDNIPATIGGKQKARLADGEFVISADVVSGLGNGSTDAGAKQLYAMMDRVRKARTGTQKMGKTIRPQKSMPA